MAEVRLQRSDRATAPRLVTEIPGPRARQHVDYDHRWTSPSLPRAYPLVPVRGQGATIEDIDGNVFVDFAAGIAVNSTGHAHPDVVRAIGEQAAELLHYSASDFYLPIYAQTCEAIAATVPISGPKRVYLGNSGAEAVEAAIKLARRSTGRPNLVSFLGAFHGRTMGAVSLTASKASYHAGFGPLLPGVHHAPYGRVEDLEYFRDVLFSSIVPASEVAAIFVEPIQGEGGYVIPEDGFLQGLREICDEHGILLVADEIQSGAGRTGRMWAIEHRGVEPDILLSAKGLASGMPLSALVARASLLESWDAGAHGSTFGGNPVACAAALVTLRLLRDGLIENATKRGEQGLRELRALEQAHPRLIEAAHGVGLMLAIRLATPELAEALQQECFRRGLLILGAGQRSVRVSPPLVIEEGLMATGLGIMADAIDALDRGAAGSPGV
ncbi:MAG: aminotransferase class III-fold pyridoxal phosphate-dependent enzyme [Chloroflexota bacterium]